jgi:hypothetical protein
MTDDALHTGRCLCGGVQYTISGPLRGIVACHCSQCRRTSGHFVAMTNCPSAALQLTRSDSLTWYRSSEKAERGFCHVCGGNLFWRQLDSGTVSITAGTLDLPTGLEIGEHIYVADKSDYYTLDDGVHQRLAE